MDKYFSFAQHIYMLEQEHIAENNRYSNDSNGSIKHCVGQLGFTIGIIYTVIFQDSKRTRLNIWAGQLSERGSSWDIWSTFYRSAAFGFGSYDMYWQWLFSCLNKRKVVKIEEEREEFTKRAAVARAHIESSGSNLSLAVRVKLIIDLLITNLMNTEWTSFQ